MSVSHGYDSNHDGDLSQATFAGRSRPTDSDGEMEPSLLTPEVSLSPTLPSGRIGVTSSDKLRGLPERLKFLESLDCNPDLNEPQVMKQGNIRPEVQAAKGARQSGQEGGDKLKTLRNIVSFIVLSWPVQGVVMAIILVDLLLTVLSFTSNEESSSRLGDWLVVIVLSLDVGGRWFVYGWKFLKSKLNIFEILLVPLTFIEVIFLADVNAPVPLLRALRPAFRVIRVLRVLVRTAGKGRGYLIHLRHTVSGDRCRFIQEGFDLDVAYITSQILAMSMPAVGAEALYLNNHLEVARFLNENHGNRYLLVNCTDEKRNYSLKPFFDRYLHFPIAKDGVPLIEDLLQLCQDLDSFLRQHSDNVIAVYSRHGQGRCSLVVLALLILRERGGEGGMGGVDSVAEVMERYRASRMDGADATGYVTSLDSQSQQRFLEYFALLVYAGNRAPPRGRKVRLKRISITGMHHSSSVFVKFHQHPDAGRVFGKQKGAKTMINSTVSRMSSDGGSVDTGGDDTDRDDAETQALATIGYRQVMVAVQRHIDEATVDSRRSGAKALMLAPILSAQTGSPTLTSGQIRCVSHAISGTELLAPVVWEVNNTTLQGEIRLEIHREDPKKRRASGSSASAMDANTVLKHVNVDIFSGVMSKIRALLCCFRCCHRQRESKPEAPRFKEGMILNTWLHADFLELNELVQDGIPARMKDKKKINILLDNHTIDKGADAPPLRSYSSMLKVMLEFEVDKRVEWKAIAEEGFNENHAVLASSTSRSQRYDLGWLTWVSERIWPSFQTGLEKLIRENIMPNLEESLPSALGVKLAQCSFGNEFPQFKEIAASSRNHDGLEVQLDIAFSYKTTVNIVIDTNLASFGISNLRIEGVLALKFKPILDTLPVFAALQLHFLNRPYLDLKFTNQLAVANFNLIKNALFGVVNKAIAGVMVLPNIICINWGDTTNDDVVSFREIFPASIIRVGITEARDLKHDRLFRRVPETFVKVVLGGQSQKTSVKTATIPVWRENFDFLVYDDRQELECILCDVDFTQRTKNAGRIKQVDDYKKNVTVSDMVAAGEDGKWYPIIAEGATTTVGSLQVKVEQYDLVANAHVISEFIDPGGEKGSAATWGDDGDSDDQVEIDTEPSIDDGTHCAKVLPGFSGFNPGHSATADAPLVHTSSADKGGAVVMLACQLQGGRAPPEDLKAGLKIQVKIGKRKEERLCREAPKLTTSTMGEKAQRAIERLGFMGLDENQIAEALQEDIEDVKQVIRRFGWNVEMNQKIIILLRPNECIGLRHIRVTMLKKSGKAVAEGLVPLRRIVRSPRCRHGEVLKCRPLQGSPIDLDIEFRLYALSRREPEVPEHEDIATPKSVPRVLSPERDSENGNGVVVAEEDVDLDELPATELPSIIVPPSLVNQGPSSQSERDEESPDLEMALPNGDQADADEQHLSV